MSTITLISGANQGIGLATATILAKEHSHHVIVGSRNADAGVKVANSLTDEGFAASSVQLDLSSDSSISAAVETIETQFGRLDVLINNAGILLDGRNVAKSTRDLYDQTFSTNVVGTACLTEAMLPLLRKSCLPRLVFVSSVMGSLTKSTDRSTSWYALDYSSYDASKAAVNMVALNFSRRLNDTGAKVNVVCPGLVATNMTGYMSWAATPEVGAKRVVDMATIGKDGPIETFSNREGKIDW